MNMTRIMLSTVVLLSGSMPSAATDLDYDKAFEAPTKFVEQLTADLWRRLNEDERQRAERATAFHTARDATGEQLAAFVREPTCNSPQLPRAAVSALNSIKLAAAAGSNPLLQAAGLNLNVADAAAQAGCAEVVSIMYRTVIRTFTGEAFAAYRQSAEIGLDDLRWAGAPVKPAQGSLPPRPPAGGADP